MIVYSIQSANMYELLLHDKHLINNGNIVDPFTIEYHFKFYTWMSTQMDIHGISRDKDKAKYPFWAWYKYSKNKQKPDLRHTGLAPKGTECVLLELEIPDKDVLLSNFDRWNCILNDYPIFDDENWDAMYNKYKKLSIEDQQKVKEESWQSVFLDLKNGPIQATFWELNIDSVRSVKTFIAK